MTGTHDVADLAGSLVDWVHSIRPDATVWFASGRSGPDDNRKPASDKEIGIRLVRVEGVAGPRSSEAVSGKLRLEYEFAVEFADPVAEQQALADLTFAILDRDDLSERSEVVRGENSALTATFELERRRELPRPKPVRETVFDLHPTAQIRGIVCAENGFPIARARLQVRDSDRLVITGRDGGFAFSAPDGTALHATVTAKGTTTDVELRPGDPNLITLAMEP